MNTLDGNGINNMSCNGSFRLSRKHYNYCRVFPKTVTIFLI